MIAQLLNCKHVILPFLNSLYEETAHVLNFMIGFVALILISPDFLFPLECN
jgi:hypothetical protein